MSMQKYYDAAEQVENQTSNFLGFHRTDRLGDLVLEME